MLLIEEEEEQVERLPMNHETKNVNIQELYNRINELERLVREKDEIIAELRSQIPSSSTSSTQVTNIQLLKSQLDAIESFAAFPNPHAEKWLGLAAETLESLCLISSNVVPFIENLVQCTRIINDNLVKYGCRHSSSYAIQGLFVVYESRTGSTDGSYGSRILRILLGIDTDNDKKMGWYSAMKHLVRINDNTNSNGNIISGEENNNKLGDEFTTTCLDELINLDITARSLGPPLSEIADKFIQAFIVYMNSQEAAQNILYVIEKAGRWEFFCDDQINSKQYKACIELICKYKKPYVKRIIYCLEGMLTNEPNITEEYEYCLSLVRRTIRNNRSIYNSNAAALLFEYMLHRHGICNDVIISESIVQMLEAAYPNIAGFSMPDEVSQFRKCLSALVEHLATSDQKVYFQRLYKFVGYKRLLNLIVSATWVFFMPHISNTNGYVFQEYIPSVEERRYLSIIYNHLKEIAPSIFEEIEHSLKDIRKILFSDMYYNQAREQTLLLLNYYKKFGRVKEFEALLNRLKCSYDVQIDKASLSNPNWLDRILVYPVKPHMDLCSKEMSSFYDVDIICIIEKLDHLVLQRGSNEQDSSRESQTIKLSTTGLTGYNVFCSYKRLEVKKKNPHFTYKEINAELGRVWRSLTTEEKKPFINQALINKQRKNETMNNSLNYLISEEIKRKHGLYTSASDILAVKRRKKNSFVDVPSQLSSAIATNFFKPIHSKSDSSNNEAYCAKYFGTSPFPTVSDSIIPSAKQSLVTPMAQQNNQDIRSQPLSTSYQPFTWQQKCQLKAQIYILKNYISLGKIPPDMLQKAAAGFDSMSNLLLYEKITLR